MRSGRGSGLPDRELGGGEVDDRAGAVEQGDPDADHPDAVLDLLAQAGLDLGHAGDLELAQLVEEDLDADATKQIPSLSQAVPPQPQHPVRDLLGV